MHTKSNIKSKLLSKFIFFERTEGVNKPFLIILKTKENTGLYDTLLTCEKELRSTTGENTSKLSVLHNQTTGVCERKVVLSAHQWMFKQYRRKNKNNNQLVAHLRTPEWAPWLVRELGRELGTELELQNKHNIVSSERELF